MEEMMKKYWLLVVIVLTILLTIKISPTLANANLVLEFEASGEEDGRWVGRFTEVDGTLEVETITAARHGDTIHLEQVWRLFPPDPIHPPDPVFPPDPISPITLSGILNLESGILVLNGGEPDSSQVHVRGQVDFNEGGSISNIIGELMFNPQPEPPEGQ
jgi:hypothetical protein